MEAFLILVAAGAVALAAIVAAVSIAHANRPPLRMRQEIEVAAGDERAPVDALRPVPPSPIDRNAALGEWRPIEEGRTR